MMSGIRGTNTKPEMQVRRLLHAAGYRYRLHGKRLPGKPDLVFLSRKAVIFVNGCFWHGHDCGLFKWPSTRSDFWRAKIGATLKRDREVKDALVETGWRVCNVYECKLRGKGRLDSADLLAQLKTFLDGNEECESIGVDQMVKMDDDV